MRLRWALVAAVAVGVAGAGALAGCGDDGDPPAGTAGDAPVVVTPALEPLPDSEVVARAGAAVWRVATDGCDWLGSGSAFAIDAHHLVTNHHVIANDTSPTLLSPTGERRSGRVIGASQEPDVAVIEVEDELPVSLQWAPTDALEAGEHVVVLGYPAPELVFTTTVGSIVNFQGRDGAREAMLTDAPIRPGNSGGPGLRADGTVAGVVTQMTLDDPDERAAIVFSAADVEPVVESFIADPDDEVLSDCGFGPDYVPPIPEHFEVPAVPPPPPVTATTLPLPVPTAPSPTATTAPTTTRRPGPTTTRPAPTTAMTLVTEPPTCPAGGLDIAVDHVDAGGGEDDGTWSVTASVVVGNGSDADIEIEGIVVDADGAAGALRMDDVVLAPGDQRRFDVPVGEPVESDAAPTVADVAATATWRWADSSQRACPAPPAVTTGS